MVNVASQFQQEMTVTSVSFEKAKMKKLPLLTICPNAVFKSPIYPLTNEQFDDNIFKLEDLLSNRSLHEFKNTSNWIIQTINGPLIGNCYTFQYTEEVQSHTFSTLLSFNRTFDFHLYIHNPGNLDLAFSDYVNSDLLQSYIVLFFLTKREIYCMVNTYLGMRTYLSYLRLICSDNLA